LREDILGTLGLADALLLGRLDAGVDVDGLFAIGGSLCFLLLLLSE
jgi:hypothetical protein